MTTSQKLSVKKSVVSNLSATKSNWATGSISLGLATGSISLAQ